MIVDASAIVAIILREPEADSFLNALATAQPNAKTHPISVWEAARGVARGSGMTISAAQDEVLNLIDAAKINIIALEIADAARALEAAQAYGRGTGHPADLNLGDCFTYGLAMRYNEPILFKGNDFTHTQIGRSGGLARLLGWSSR